MKKGLLVFVFLFLSLYVLGQACTLSVNLSASSPSICSGSAVVLTASGAGGSGNYNYVWNTGETTAKISVNKAGTYTVSVTDKNSNCPAVSKPISITTADVPDAPTADSDPVCYNTSATLTASAPGGTYQWFDANGTFLFTGNPYRSDPIKSTTTFYVSTTINGCTSERSSVTVTLLSKPVVTSQPVCAGNSAVLTATGGDSFDWYATASGGSPIFNGAVFTTPPLQSSRAYYVVAIVNGCASARTQVIATVGAPPPDPVAKPVSVCFGSSANLHADAPSGIFDWFDVPSGGTSLISSPDFTTPSLTSTKTYYVQTSLNDCVSNRIAVKVTVNQIPTAPVVSGPAAICQGTSTTLAVTSPTDTYEWYDALSGGNKLHTGNTFTTPVLNTSTNYYVQTVAAGGCTSTTRTTVRVNINPPPPAPSAQGGIICAGSFTTLTATFPGGTYKWYDSPAAAVPLFTGNGYITPALNVSTTYYVETTVNGCTSPRAPVTVSVLPLPAAPTAPGKTICSGDAAVLTGSGSAGDYEWYDAPTDGNLLLISQVYITPPLSTTTTYYLQTTGTNGCASTRTPVIVTVSPTPTTPTVTASAPVCKGNTANLSATVASGTIEWYDDATAGNLLQTGNNFTTPTLGATTTYYIQNRIGSCVSERIPVKATVTSIADPAFQYRSGNFCTSGTNPVPVINNPAGGTFSASAPGLVFVDTHTGEINIGASSPGFYTISFINNGICPTVSTFDVVVGSTPHTHFIYGGPYCQDGIDPLPAFSSGAAAGSFTAAPSGLVFKNTTTGEIDLSASKPGTYTITNRSEANGTCSSSESTATVTIYRKVTVDAGPDQSVAAGVPVKLAGSFSGAPGVKWSGGAGAFSDKTNPKAVYTPAPGETTATLVLTTGDPPGPCGPQSSTVVITISAVPDVPIASVAPVCYGNSANFSAIGPGGQYKWYSKQTGGTLLASGPVYPTPPLTANVTVYLQTTINGVTSTRVPVTAIVTPPPVKPVVTSLPICSGTSAVLKATGSAGSYEWYDAPVGGNKIWITDTFTTPVLTSNTSYYVQSKVNDCISERTKVDVQIKPSPVITSGPNDNVCSENPLNYVITADIPAATFSWGRAPVPGISNPAVSDQTSATITEALINTGTTNIDVTYLITPILDGCAGAPFTYIVTVYPKPMVTNSTLPPICNKTATNYTIQFNVPGTSAKWSRAAVPGISNSPVNNQAAPVIREVLFNTTDAPIEVTYTFTYGTKICSGLTTDIKVTVNPPVKITSNDADPACSDNPISYTITSNIPSATFTWSRDAVANIANPPVSGQTSATINETLVNTSTRPVKVDYIITPTANGCTDDPFTYTVTVAPPPPTPSNYGSNTPVCINNQIELKTAKVPKATYLWIGPDGRQYTQQNPVIPNATKKDAGIYNLFIKVGDCVSLPIPVNVEVDDLPIVDAGSPIRVCNTVTEVQLDGNVNGTGIWLPLKGTGTFSADNDPKAIYTPSQADKDAGSVTLRLASTSKAGCAIKTDDVTITFGPSPSVIAGRIAPVCSQDIAVQLHGTPLINGGVRWSTAGTGVFKPSELDKDAQYFPSAADVKAGSVLLTITATSAGTCDIPTDTTSIHFIPPPTVTAERIRYVLKGNLIVLNPTVSDRNVKYLWTPNVNINDNTVRNPEIKGDVDGYYKLTVTDSRGCVSVDSTFVKVSPVIMVKNAFTPNGDGFNDQWNITGLIAYQDATVDIFDRYGQKIFHSLGYPKAWDGTYNGKVLPVGTYYYVIDTKLNGLVLSGYVAIIR